MAFATDRDCVALEPGVIGEAAWAGQRVLSGSGSVSGTTLTLEPGGVTLAQAGIAPGHVVVVGGVTLEIVSVESDLGATVSVLRGGVEEPAVPPGDIGASPVEVHSFAPVLETVHRQVLRMAGIDPDDTEGLLTEADVLNPGALRELEACGALHLIYSAVAAAGPIGGAMEKKANAWRDRFWGERSRARVLLDLDGDGEADASRRLNAARFVRG
ncbi:MAG: hypothetical protein ACF8Q5_05655 [Phycisphaerales bacterium JB040]